MQTDTQPTEAVWIHTHPEIPVPPKPAPAPPVVEPAAPIIPEPLDVYIEEQAAPIRIQITLPSDKMNEQLDAKYNIFIENLTPAQEKMLLKGGRRQITKGRVYGKFGGFTGFYSDILHEAVMREVAKKGIGEVLTVYSIESQDMPQGFVIQSVAYLEPTIVFKTPPPPTFSAYMPPLTDEDTKKRVDTRMKGIQEQHAVYTLDTSGLPIRPFQHATISLKTEVDGKPFVPFTWTDQRVEFEGPSGQKPFFLDRLIGGHVASDIIEFDFMQPQVDAEGATLPFGGLRLQGTIIIHSIHDKATPPVDDELAISANYETFAQMLGQFTKDAEDELTKEREEITVGLVGRSLGEAATVSPVPELWARRKAEELIKQQMQQFNGSEKQLLQQAGVASIDQLQGMHYQNLRHQLRMQLILRKWGIMHNVPGDHSLSGTHKYVVAVTRHILNTMDYMDADKTELLPWDGEPNASTSQSGR